jgi:O-antigen/teichoic acid export membrane protein
MHGSLTRSSVFGVAWLLMQNAGGRAIGLLGQLVLAGLLHPADFGVVALAYSVATVIGTLASFGIDDVLLSRVRKIKLWVRYAPLLNLALAMAGAAVTLAAAPAATAIYANSLVGSLIAILALGVPFTALSAVPSVILQSQFRFRFLAIYSTLELAAVQIATIALALANFGAYSFVIPFPLAAAAKAIIFWRVTNTKLAWKIRPWVWKHLLSAGFAVFGQRLFLEVRNNADRIVLGLLASDAVVGLYFFAARLAVVPTYTLIASLGRVLLPALAHLRSDPVRQLAATLRASRLMALVVLPLAMLQSVLAAPLLHLLFGEKWMGSVPPLQILSIGLAFDVVPCVAGMLTSANGKFRFQLAWTALPLPFFLVLIICGGWLGSATGLAFGVAIFYVLFAVAYTYSALRSFGCSIGAVLQIYIIPLGCSLLAIGPPAALLQLGYLAGSDLGSIIAITAWSGVVYPSLVALASPSIIQEIRMRVLGSVFVDP